MSNVFKCAYLLLLLFIITTSYAKAQDNIKIDASVARGNVRITSVYLEDAGITVFIDNDGRLHDVYVNDTDTYYDPIKDADAFNAVNEVEYYPNNYIFEELSGRIKRIGNLYITYYDRFGWEELKGKVKSVGNIHFTYYDRFGWDETKGKIKSIGTVPITYYDRFGRDEDKGKIKSLGNSSFSYTGLAVIVNGYDKNGVLNLRRSAVRQSAYAE